MINLADRLTAVELRDLPAVKHGRFNNILKWLPALRQLTMAVDYIDEEFGCRSTEFAADSHWQFAKPLQELTLVTSGQQELDPRHAFTLVDMWDLIDTRFLGRLRKLSVAASTGWERVDDGDLWETVRIHLFALDKENWEKRRWHYENLRGVPEGMAYEAWLDTFEGWRNRPKAQIVRNI